MLHFIYAKRTVFMDAKQRVFEESNNLKGFKLISNFFTKSSFFDFYRKSRKDLFFLRKRHKRYWSLNRFIFNKNLWRTKFIYGRNNQFFQNFYLYRLKRYINFYKYFLYKSNKLNYFGLESNFIKLLVSYSKFFDNYNSKGFFSFIFKSNFSLKYDFTYIKKEKLKLKTFYNIKKNNLFLKKIRRFFTGNQSNFNRLLVNYLELCLSTIVFRSKFTHSLYISNQLVKHGFFEIDGKIITKPIYQLSINEVVNLIPNYSLYLKERRLSILLESYLKWFTGFNDWSEKNTLNILNSLLISYYFVNNFKHNFNSRYFSSNTQFIDYSSIKFNIDTKGKKKLISDIINISSDSLLVVNKNNFNKGVFLFFFEIFQLIKQHLNKIFKDLFINYLLVNNKLSLVSSPNYHLKFFLKIFSKFNPIVVFLKLVNKSFHRLNKPRFFSIRFNQYGLTNRSKKRLTRLPLKVRRVFNRYMKNRQFRIKKKLNKFYKKWVFFNKLSKYVKLKRKTNLNLPFLFSINSRNFGLGNYLVKKNNIVYNLNRLSFLYKNRDYKGRRRNIFNVSDDLLITLFKEFVSRNGKISDISLNKKLFSYFYSESKFIEVYFKLVNSFFSKHFYTFSSFDNFINIFLNKNFIFNLFFLNKNEVDLNTFINNKKIILLDNYKFYDNYNINLFSDIVINNKKLLIKNYLYEISNYGNNLLNNLKYKSYLKKIKQGLPFFYFNKNRYFRFGFLDITNLFSFSLNKKIGFFSSYTVIDWFRIRNINLRFKKFILYYFFIENILLLKDFSNYKLRRKNFIFEYSLKFFGIQSYYLDKFYLIFVYNTSKNKFKIFFYPKVFSSKFNYKNKYIGTYNSLFTNYKYNKFFTVLKLNNSLGVTFDYYRYYKDFIEFKKLLNKSIILNNYLNKVKNSFGGFSNKIMIFLFEIIRQIKRGNNDVNSINSFLTKIVYYFLINKKTKFMFNGAENRIYFNYSKRDFSFNFKKSKVIEYSFYRNMELFPFFSKNLLRVLNIVPNYLEIDYELNTVLVSYFPYSSEVPFINNIDTKSLSNVFKSCSKY